MQSQSHAQEVGNVHEHGGALSQTVRLVLLFAGSLLVVAAFLADWIYRDNTMVGDFSATIGAILLALPIFWVAILDLWEGHMHMDELVALAVLAAMAAGDFRVAGVVAFFMLISQVIETRTAQGAHRAIEKLVRMSPTRARRLPADGGEEEVDVTALEIGDRVRVLPGETVPTDGRILLGHTTLNEASITGESAPRDRKEGEDAFAGSVNLTGMIEVEVSRVGEDTTLGRVQRLILSAEQTRMPITKIVDRYAGYYTPVVLMIAALVWFFTEDWSRVISILVISCPCAFILATPTAMVAALSAAARCGILVKNVVDLESASRITAMIFDKTGTLTRGELGVSRLAPVEGVAPADLLRAAVSAEQYSNHPAAEAIRELATSSEVPPAEVSDMREEPGKGVSAMIAGEKLCCGRLEWLRACGVDVAGDDAADAEGLSVLHVGRGGRHLGWIGLRDQVREDAAEVVADLRGLGLKRLAMISGDREAVASRTASDVGDLEYEAECLPEEKSSYVEKIKNQGFHVAFVGDGVNDAPALAMSNTGIAMGAAGSDVAIHSATVALMSNDLRRIPYLIRLSRSAKHVVLQNVMVGVVFIVGGLVFSGLGMLNPIVATLLHNVGSLIVVFNSARLVRFGEDPEPERAQLPEPALSPGV